MPTELKLSWLAGVWDGDGSISVFKNYEHKTGVTKMCPTLVFVNRSQSLINEIIKIADELEISFHIFERKVSKEEHAVTIQLVTRNMKYIKIFLEAIIPYLIGKKAQAELTLRLVNKRLQYMEKSKSNFDLPPYDKEDEQIKDKVKQLNKRGPNPQRL